ncbi:PEP-CTERM system TPR-repeat protein PrsT [Pseudodesulfovibrio thermohalotolerans]|uniref:XrtA/PEP-CTERM system TPR-repeat protein PrsT n=1 Tax=Pseudodesulfovibrio thermohalotolerans TaxID=2880651 RepID=UPI002441AEB7|nr:XrtA/PEP-CTERM system TPR-repeat protein PrsT [Pseudodesulfovibrio thermohalotolerans]WFS61610.1 PEP-CTERM system TPR-repeat protein PrsT [Pseudodesulfovibrio thermohalotolerans]
MKLTRFLYLTLIIVLLAGCGNNDIDKMLGEGEQYRDSGNYSGAIVIYKTILEKDPNQLQARLGLAQSYLATGKLDQARKNFDKYKLQNPYDKELNYDLARLERLSKNRSKALELVEAYCSANPKSVDGALLYGRLLLEDSDTEGAEKWFNKAVELSPDNSEAHIGLARVYRAQGRIAAADKAIADVLAKDPTNREALYLRASSELERGDKEAYRATFTYISDSHPSDVYAKYIKAQSLLEQQEYGKAAELAKQLNAMAPNLPYGQKVTGMSMYLQKQYQEAINAFHKAVTLASDPESHFFLGLSYYAVGDLETAISHLRVAADGPGNFLKAREMISMILLQQHRVDESMAEARKVLEKDADNVVARMTLGDALTMKGEREKAIEQYEAVAKSRPSDSGTLLKMGALNYSLGNVEEAETDLTRAVAASPDSIRPMIILSAFYMKNGEKGLARSTLESGLSGNKNDSVLYFLLARVALSDNDVEKAREYLGKSKESNPDNPDPYLTLAALDLAQKKPEGALNEYSTFVDRHPDFVRAWLGKALVLQLLNRQDEAEATFKEALKTDAPEAYLGYAESLTRKGRAEEGLAILKQGSEKLPFNINIERAKAQILLSMKRYDEVLLLCDQLEKQNKSAALGLRTRTYMLKGDYDKAVGSARDIIEIYPGEPMGYITLADIYATKGDKTNQLAVLEEGRSRCEANSSLMVAIGNYYLAAGETKKALTYIDAAIKRDENNYVARTVRGDICVLLGRDKDAAVSYNNALRLSQRYVPALNNLAMLYLKNPKTRLEALRLGYTAYMQRPGDPAVLDTFGYSLAVNGRLDEAVQVLEKALEVAGSNPDIEYHLGYAYKAAGKNDKALPLLEKVANCPDCANAAEAKKLLAAIMGE